MAEVTAVGGETEGEGRAFVTIRMATWALCPPH